MSKKVSQKESRGSVPEIAKKDYKEIIERIQSIGFITDYLKNNPTLKLDIYYFNNPFVFNFSCAHVSIFSGGNSLVVKTVHKTENKKTAAPM